MVREREEEERRRSEAARRQSEAESLEERSKKDALLARLKELDSKEGSDSRRGSTNDYSFSKPIDNMHHGLPAYESPAGKGRGRYLEQSDDDVTGYQPSFVVAKTKRSAGSGGKMRRTKKADLMTELFGATSTAKSSPIEQPQPPPDDKPFMTSLNNNNVETRHHDTSSMALFGGGSAILDDDDVPQRNQSHLLPRRSRQMATTIHTQPTINAIDDFDDDIEEVIL